MRQDKKRWENHQMYLEVGKYGTFYTLHGFMCTHPLDDLDEEGMKAIKIAGLIKYKVVATYTSYTCTCMYCT